MIVAHYGGTPLILMACTPSTRNLRASQFCITAQKALSQVVSYVIQLVKREINVIGFSFKLHCLEKYFFFHLLKLR